MKRRPKVGQPIRVLFGSKRVYAGTVIEVLTNEPDSSKVRVRIFSQLQKKPGIADENIVAEFIDLNKKKESTASWEHIHD